MAKGSGGSIQVNKARYAKGKVAVRASDGSGYKTRHAGIIEGMGGKFSHREGAYIMSSSAASRARRVAQAGYNYSPFSQTFYRTLNGPRYSRAEIIKRFR
jgi:hypothetical protein